MKERFRQLLKESNLTYESASKLIKSNATTISSWFNKGNFRNGKLFKGSKKFYELCQKLSWNPEWILTGIGPRRVPLEEKKQIQELKERLIKMEGKLEQLESMFIKFKKINQ